MQHSIDRSFFLAATLTAASLCLNATPARAASLIVNQNNNPTALITSLLGNTSGLDASSFNVQTIGNAQAFGTFQQDPFGLASGVVVGTGKVTDIPGINKCYGKCTDVSTDFPTGGTPSDTNQLRFTFTATTATTLYFQYVFGSEELPEWVGSSFNDAFSLTLNGQSLAKLSNNAAVTINNLAASTDLILNPPGTGAANQETKLDGYSKPLLFAGALRPGQTNTLIVTIGDVGDGIYDSAVFLKAGTLGTVRPLDISGGASGCSATPATGGIGSTRIVAGAPTGSDTGIFNCTNIGRPDGGIPVTNPPGGGTAVPEPFAIVGTIIGGTTALKMRRKLKANSVSHTS
jgi:hypothetical protein